MTPKADIRLFSLQLNIMEQRSLFARRNAQASVEKSNKKLKELTREITTRLPNGWYFKEGGTTEFDNDVKIVEETYNGDGTLGSQVYNNLMY